MVTESRAGGGGELPRPGELGGRFRRLRLIFNDKSFCPQRFRAEEKNTDPPKMPKNIPEHISPKLFSTIIIVERLKLHTANGRWMFRRIPKLRSVSVIHTCIGLWPNTRSIPRLTGGPINLTLIVSKGHNMERK